jgi:hypothetical protein
MAFRFRPRNNARAGRPVFIVMAELHFYFNYLYKI